MLTHLLLDLKPFNFMNDFVSYSDVEYISIAGHTTRTKHQVKVDDSEQLFQNKSIQPNSTQSISTSLPEPTGHLTMSGSRTQESPLEPLAQAHHSIQFDEILLF